MKILNKFIWSKTEPKNKNDIWFDGSVFNLYRNDTWEAFTLPVDAAEKVAEVIKNVSEVYQEKLNAGYGIIIEGNTISVDPNLKNYDDTQVWESIDFLQDNKANRSELNNYVPTERFISTTQTLSDSLGDIAAIKADKTEVNKELAKLSEDVSNLSDEVESNGVLIEDLQNTKIDRENDDYYPKMAVGLADNLAGVDVVDSEINFRRSGGGAISDGVARIEAIKGNSVVWNQYSKNYVHYAQGWHHKEYSKLGLLNYDIDTNTLTITCEDSTKSSVAMLLCTFKAGHKILISFGLELKTNVERTGNPYIGYFGTPTQWLSQTQLNDVTNKRVDFNIFTTLSSDTIHIFLGLYGGEISPSYVEGDKVVIYSPRIIDLTQMFGAGNEPTTIEEFYARIPMGVDLNAYNEGEVIHMDVQSIESQGVNVWDGLLEQGRLSGGEPSNTTSTNYVYTPTYIQVIPNAEYYASVGKLNDKQVNFYPSYYDGNKVFISSGNGIYNTKFTIPSNARYLRFFVYVDGSINTDFSDICINLSDTSINGKYFPYIKRVEDLAVIRKYFPQGMKSAGTAHDEIRYNKATQKWEKVVRIGEAKMKDLNWAYEAEQGYFYNTNTFASYYSISEVCCLSSKYESLSWSQFVANYGGAKSNAIAVYSVSTGNRLNVVDSRFTDAASFKASLTDDDIAYIILAEPIVTELDAEDQFKDLDYQVWNCGTEKAIAEGKSAPLAADITYGFNAIGKIKELESLVAALRAKVGI